MIPFKNGFYFFEELLEVSSVSLGSKQLSALTEKLRKHRALIHRLNTLLFLECKFEHNHSQQSLIYVKLSFIEKAKHAFCGLR
jgi:hypothetical protein